MTHRKLRTLGCLAVVLLIGGVAANAPAQGAADQPQDETIKKATPKAPPPEGRTQENQPGVDQATTQGGPPPPPAGGLFGGNAPFLIVMVGLLAVMFIWSGRSKKKQEQKRRDMLASLKKGDKITSIGGIVGTVIETREDELVVKVDDNVRLRFARWAVRGTGDTAKTEKPDQQR